MQEHAQSVTPKTQPANTSNPARATTPAPIDPALLRQIAGGVDTSTSMPSKGW